VGKMESIPFLVTLPGKTVENDEMGMFGALRSESDIGLKQIPADVLKNNLANISASILNVLADIDQVGKFRLKEVTLEVEVSASGGVSLIGTANMGGKGAISLKFTE
jgi:hypothetical protein